MSSSYNPLEKNIAKILSKFPGIKNNVKRIYQSVNFIIHKKKYNHKTDYTIKKISIDKKDSESFFGYYDKSPINISNEYIIFHSLDSDRIKTTNNPNKKKYLNIVLYNIKENNYKIIDKSYSYNWQQGTKLQWLDENRFIYNVFENGEYLSKIYNIIEEKIETNTVKEPIYDCYKNEYALTLNFERLMALRPDYGYRNKEKTNFNISEIKNDGIYYIDLKNDKENNKRLIISIDLIKNHHKQKSMENAKHKFNHIMISPDGKKFIFMHRWIKSTGERYDSLFLSDIDGKNLKVISDNDMVSHCCWDGNNTVVGYYRDKKLNGDKFYSYDLKTEEISILSKKLDSFGDGHPSFYKNKMLFDTYPDRSRMQHIYIYDKKNNEVRNIASFFQSIKYFGETRCDLHPRWSFDGQKIFFDSVHEGKRNLYMMEI